MSLTGRVVWLAEALARQGDAQVDADQGTSVAVLEAADGRLWPLMKDARGRGFWLDERLRQREVELLVRRFADLPWIQVIRVYTVRDGERYWFDYWCDICAIPMFELKACECCQGPIRMRERPLGPDGQPLEEPQAE